MGPTTVLDADTRKVDAAGRALRFVNKDTHTYIHTYINASIHIYSCMQLPVKTE